MKKTPNIWQKDIAIEKAKVLYIFHKKDSMEYLDNAWKVEQYLKFILEAGDVLVFYSARSDNCIIKDVCTIRPTGVLQANFELYGCTLHADSYIKS